MLRSGRSFSAVAILIALIFAFAFLHDHSSAVDSSGTRQASPSQARPRTTSNQKKSGENTERRLREGTQIRGESGYFRLDGDDGATFVTESGHEFGGLPNLNLERVVRILKNAEDSEYVRWTVSGTVTEFSDRNFLLISRAIYKSIAQPPLPERLQ